jgi:phosphohistidine phosphatase
MPLQRLILLRHGKAEERSSSGKDFDRPLAPRGHREAREMGQRLADAGFRPDVALVSPARRAAQTWEEASAAFPDARLDLIPALYNANPTALMEAAEDSGAGTAILVAHNPGMHALAFELVTRGPAGSTTGRAIAHGFPTAAAAVFRFEEGKPVCEALFTPKDEGDA